MNRVPVVWHLPALVGIFLALCYLLSFPGTIAPHVSDGRAMYMVTQALVDRHDVAIVPMLPHEVKVVPGWRALPLPTGSCATEPATDGIGERPGGPYFVKYGIGQSLAAIPLYVVGQQVARAVPTAVRLETVAFVTSAYNVLVTACTAALLCALALRLGWRPRVALAIALLFGLATAACPYSTTFFSEPTVAFCLLGALATALWNENIASPRTVLLTGCWLGMSLLTHLADSVLYVPAFTVFLLARSPRSAWPRLLLLLAAPLALCLGVVGGYDLARFGNVLSTGYGLVGDYHDLHPRHSLQALWEGIYGPLLSPGKGLVWYAPILVLAPWAFQRFGRRDRAAAWLCLALIVIDVLAHANTLIVWLGGWAWGPRFLVPIIPIALLPLGSLLQTGGRVVARLAVGLGVLGAIIQLPAVLVDYGVYITRLRDQQPDQCIWHAEDLYKWHPQYSPLIGQWQVLFDPSTYRLPLTHDAVTIGAGQFSAAPHPWWGLLADQGVPVGVLTVIVIGIGFAAAFALVGTLRMANTNMEAQAGR